MPNPLTADLEDVLVQTRDLWEDLRGARLFITGGTGFFGCWLLETFTHACDRLQLHATATVLTRSPEVFRAKAPHLASHHSVRLVAGDVRQFAFPQGGFTHVIHGATDASVVLNREHPLLMLDTIVDGTRRVLDFAVGSGVKRFLLISSGAVYGRQPPEISHVNETYNGAPDTTDAKQAYGEGKRMAEFLTAVYASQHGIACPIARPFAFTGPYLPLDAHFAIGNFILDVLNGRPIEIRGDGTPLRSYLYAADLAIWLWTILVRGESAQAYNVGSENAIRIRDLASLVASALDGRNEIRVAQESRPGIPTERYVPSTHRARTELGLRQSVSIEEAIRRTASPACVVGGVR